MIESTRCGRSSGRTHKDALRTTTPRTPWPLLLSTRLCPPVPSLGSVNRTALFSLPTADQTPPRSLLYMMSTPDTAGSWGSGNHQPRPSPPEPPAPAAHPAHCFFTTVVSQLQLNVSSPGWLLCGSFFHNLHPSARPQHSVVGPTPHNSIRGSLSDAWAICKSGSGAGTHSKGLTVPDSLEFLEHSMTVRWPLPSTL